MFSNWNLHFDTVEKNLSFPIQVISIHLLLLIGGTIAS
jgi:hypothetical protein